MNQWRQCDEIQAGLHLEQQPGWSCFGRAMTISPLVWGEQAGRSLANVPPQRAEERVVVDDVAEVAEDSDAAVDAAVPHQVDRARQCDSRFHRQLQRLARRSVPEEAGARPESGSL